MDIDPTIMDGETWLDCEIEVLRNGYATGESLDSIARKLKRSPDYIRRQARRLGIAKRQIESYRRCSWEHLDDAIREHYPAGGVKAVRRVHPGTPSGVIHGRARNIKVLRHKARAAHRDPEFMKRLVVEARESSFSKVAARYGLTTAQVGGAIRDAKSIIRASQP